jgi:hypothetical protein
MDEDTLEQKRAAGLVGGLVTAARYDGREITAAARKGRWQSYLDKVPARFTDPADREERARKLWLADQRRYAQLAAAARTRAAKARQAERAALAELEAINDAGPDLDATALADAGSDGADL